jgi:hypothetical protein
MPLNSRFFWLRFCERLEARNHIEEFLVDGSLANSVEGAI